MKTSRKNYLKWAIIIVLVFAILTANFCILYVYIRNNAISAKKQEVMHTAIDFNNFLVESIDAVKITSQIVEEMRRSDSSSDEILTYLERNTSIYSKTINKSFTGFYGYINDEYLDGVGWIPEEDYVPTERPWYKEAIKADGAIAFVSPYIDSQTGNVAMSFSKMLSNQKDVISIDISLDVLQKIIEESTIRNGWTYGMILDNNNYVVAHSEIGEIGKCYDDKSSGKGYEIFNKYSKAKKLGIIKIDGVRYIVLTADIGDTWKLISVIKASEVIGSIRKILIIFAITLISIFVIAVKLILDLKKKQQKESYTYDQLRSLAKFYDLIFLIDIGTDRFYEFVENKTDVGFLIDNENKRAQYNLRIIMDALTDRRYKKSVFDFIELSTIGERLQDKYVVSKSFVNNNNKQYGIRFAPVEKDDNGRVTKVIFMVENLNED